MNINPIKLYKYQKVYKTIKNSGLFDSKYYLFTYPDVRAQDIDPIKHYILNGAKEGRNPSTHFDTKYYLTTYKDIEVNKINPLFHYIVFGWKENRNPSSSFDTKFYLDTYKDVKERGINPLLHFVKYGKIEGRYSNKKIVKNSKSNGVYSLLNMEELLTKKEKLLQEYKQYLENNKSTFSDKVSIIILNRNGAHHLKVLLSSIEKYTQYQNYQIIVLDNGSDDNSEKVLENYQSKIPLIIEKRLENGTFSARNNEVAKKYESDYYIFMNNDIEVTYGWLNELLRVYKSDELIGAVGCKLLYPIEHPNDNQKLMLQHGGIAFRREFGFIRPYNISDDEKYLDLEVEYKEVAAVTAALVMIDKNTFFEVDMFDEKYNYGYEDVDLCLKIKELGYKIVYAPSVLAFHHEFGTQKTNCNIEVVNRRKNNMDYFKKKWFFNLQKNIFNEKISNKTTSYSKDTLTIAFLVTDNENTTTAGDYFTALELGKEFEKFGWKVKYLSRIKKEWEDKYDNVDVLISMLHNFNPLDFKSTQSVLKIAWARNWFDKWCETSIHYDIIYASSHKACDFMREKINHDVRYLPIATNDNRFNLDIEKNQRFKSDYCFTGSYWGVHREIIDLLEPSELNQFNFSIYGEGWDKIEKFKPFHKGFINYQDIPFVYANTKIVIDDANHVTKPYGAVNSRVFDALCAGVLVLTNGKFGSFDIFEGKLPYFETKEELNELLKKYLLNDELRNSLTKELRDIVIQKNLYQHRAKTLKQDLSNYFTSERYLIKLPVPKWKERINWGDYHYGVSIKKYLERSGYPTKLQILSEWNNEEGLEYENIIVLRGLSKYETKEGQYNIMWNISHPDKVTIDEYDTYDKVFIASNIWADKISNKVKRTKVYPLLQCTDSEVFKIPKEIEKEEYKCDILFVGNSRKVFRKIVKDTIEILPRLGINVDFRIYGKDWEEFIDKKYIYGESIPNTELYKYYGSAKVVLNDHWDDMKEKGFISNRIFDVLSSNGNIITDYVDGIENIDDTRIFVYYNKEDLVNFITKSSSNENIIQPVANSFEKKVSFIIRNTVR